MLIQTLKVAISAMISHWDYFPWAVILQSFNRTYFVLSAVLREWHYYFSQVNTMSWEFKCLADSEPMDFELFQNRLCAFFGEDTEDKWTLVHRGGCCALGYWPPNWGHGTSKGPLKTARLLGCLRNKQEPVLSFQTNFPFIHWHHGRRSTHRTVLGINCWLVSSTGARVDIWIQGHFHTSLSHQAAWYNRIL
jgi:hypothetical protein